MLHRKKLLSAAGMLAIIGAAQATRASYLATDPYSIPAFTGSITDNNSGTTGTLNVTVDYAVYAPGTFPTAPPVTGVDDVYGGAPTDLTKIPQYVYLYLVNNSTASTLGINLMSVGTETGAVTNFPGSNPSLGGTAPYYQNVVPNSFINLFAGIANGSSSSIVMFTSTQPPTFQSSTVGNGGLNDAVLLPSPLVPEPGTFSLLALGSAATLTLGRRRRRALV